MEDISIVEEGQITKTLKSSNFIYQNDKFINFSFQESLNVLNKNVFSKNTAKRFF